MLVSNTHRSAVSRRFLPFSAPVPPFDVFLTPPSVLQIVEMLLRMARLALQVPIAVSRAQAMRLRLVVPVIASTCIGVARPPHLHLKSSQALEHGSHWDAIREFCHNIPLREPSI